MTPTKTEERREVKGRALASGLLLVVFLISYVLIGAGPAYAATFAVDSTSTAGDANLSDNTCDTNPLPSVTICTLPAAIQEANQFPTVDTINFAILGNGPHTIVLTNELPTIVRPLTINGYSQGDSTPATTADDASENTATTGTNAVLKIELRGPGGASPSGNTANGVNTSNTTGVNVLGNLIGTNRTGRSPLANGSQGVRIDGSDNTIGGSAANTIAFNGGNGVQVFGTGNRIVSNSIFVNDQNGVVINSGNRILRNSISFNGALGIDLGDDGVNANDPRDPDTGANNLQNRPVITSAVTTGSSTTIRGRINSTPRRTFTVQFFAACCESESFLVGQKQIKTNRRGTVSFVFVPAQAVLVGSVMAATATNGGGNTSEFSAAVIVS